jgi:hypothetical protein
MLSAKSHNSPKKLWMGQYVATAPEGFIVRVSDDYSGTKTRG